jgi:hypothetical protein
MRSTLADAPLYVSTDGMAGPYVTVTTEQLAPVVNALQAESISFQIDEDAVMMNGRPALSVIDLGHGADADRVQGILDRLSAQWRTDRVEPRQAATTYNELIIKCSPIELKELVQRIESTPRAGWVRRGEIEKRMRKMRAEKVGAYCFSKHFESLQKEVAVWLQTRGAGELYVTTVIALRSRESLSVDQYNEVLSDFEDTFITPLMHGVKGHVFNYPAPTEPTLEDVLSVDSLQCLQSFSRLANKGMLHPLDLQRWQGFIAQTHLEDTVLYTPLLSDWLAGEGWSQDQRAWLINSYESGRSLLSVYDEESAER